ncbi:hypothetical protein M413DRAFT_340771 [Hebeloma cylindrosporum]|uniref:Uncharacterized protein n=1 Tax=Hebeloma cylindrosporum TaxID=76867 RepID=A0A0C3CMU3_HEBCY|nr:hypothetical protein M413DRAFT_340771 [Hebeloma cylindrosporum h7]
MLLAKYRNRARKARKRPVGFASVFPHFSAAEQTNTPDTEMSQSQSSPLIPPAGASAARVAPDSAPPYRHSHSFYGEDRTIDPFFSPYSTPDVPPHHSAIVEGSPPPNEHTRSDASSGHEPLQSPYETGLPPLAMADVLPHDAGLLPSSFPPEPSGLHHEMATFQKALEGDAKGIDAQLTRQTSQLETRGSPPKYHG